MAEKKTVRYTPEFKRQMVDLVRSGQTPAVAVSGQAIRIAYSAFSRTRSFSARRPASRR